MKLEKYKDVEFKKGSYLIEVRGLKLVDLDKAVEYYLSYLIEVRGLKPEG